MRQPEITAGANKLSRTTISSLIPILDWTCYCCTVCSYVVTARTPSMCLQLPDANLTNSLTVVHGFVESYASNDTSQGIPDAGTKLNKPGSLDQNFGSSSSTGAKIPCGSVVWLWLNPEATHRETKLAGDHEQVQLAPQTVNVVEQSNVENSDTSVCNPRLHIPQPWSLTPSPSAVRLLRHESHPPCMDTSRQFDATISVWN